MSTNTPPNPCALCREREASVELEAKVPGVPNSTSILKVCDECAIVVLDRLIGVPTSASPSPEMSDLHPEPAPEPAKRRLVCMACREGKHGDCERPANRMPSWPVLAICECEHPSHRIYPTPESEAR